MRITETCRKWLSSFGGALQMTLCRAREQSKNENAGRVTDRLTLDPGGPAPGPHPQPWEIVLWRNHIRSVSLITQNAVG